MLWLAARRTFIFTWGEHHMFFNKVSPVNNFLRPKSRFFFFLPLLRLLLNFIEIFKADFHSFFFQFGVHTQSKASLRWRHLHKTTLATSFFHTLLSVMRLLQSLPSSSDLKKNPTLVICTRLHYDTLTLLKSKPSNSKCDNPVAASPCTHLS